MPTPSDLFYREIPLSQGKVALVDAEDYEWLSQWKWCAQKHFKTFYAMRKEKRLDGKRTTVKMHRAIMGLQCGDTIQVDHHNCNGLDNRRCNIRFATSQENSRNRSVRVDNKSGIKGIHKQGNRWKAQITGDGGKIFLGYFGTPEEAHAAYCAAAKQHHGEFACLGSKENVDTEPDTA
jgi:hypothetical protein